MNTIATNVCSPADRGPPPLQSPVTPANLMVGDEPCSESEEHGSLAAHRDARQLVRLVQCPQCSKPFVAPVTLPCGHTICQHCLPESRLRSNISYPNTLDHQLGTTCPTCGLEHSAAECKVDVTFAKLMEVIKLEIAAQALLLQNTPTLLQELPQQDDSDPMIEKEKSSGMGRTGVFHGGRLASTFAMAERGLLLYSADILYTSQSSNSNDYEALDVALLNRLREVAHKELDCLVCYNIMLEPTTTPCGHTFCRRCLTRVMDHSSICPICRQELHIPASLQNQPSNVRLVSLLHSLCPDLIAARESALSKEECPAEDILDTPLFICTLSLPTMPTFLHIFEPRYRLMMRRCMEGSRRFGMVMYNRTSAPQGQLGATRFLEYGTLLEIVNFQLLRDGRSFVETRGISRFRIVAHGMLDGYDVARVERIEDVSLSREMRNEEAELERAKIQAEVYNAENPQVPMTPDNFPDLQSTQELFMKCRGFVERMRARSAPWLSEKIVQVYGNCPDDLALFPYWFAAVLPIAEEEKYQLLKFTSARERLKTVHGWVKRIEGQRW